MSAPRDLKRTIKRLIILSDGTWQTMENAVPTNILQLALSIEAEDAAGVQQLVFYDAGVGTDNGTLDKVVGGAMGAGLDKNIIQLYSFLAQNYEPGDEIYLFGFSRGAYTVRSVAGMMNVVGLVRRKKIQWVQEAYNLYRNRKLEDPDPISCRTFRSNYGERVPIKLLMCFDTVGSLGLPVSGLPGSFDSKRYAFHNTTLSPRIENAIHALSIGEQTFGFQPTMMDFHPDAGEQQLTQKYFWGKHSGVGGGDKSPDQIESAKRVLIWTIGEMERRGLGLSIDKSLIPDKFDIKVEEVIVKATGVWALLEFATGKITRDIPSLDWIDEAAIKRYSLVDKYRPEALKKFADELSKM